MYLALREVKFQKGVQPTAGWAASWCMPDGRERGPGNALSTECVSAPCGKNSTGFMPDIFQEKSN
jgi:hypothetical protein